MADPKYADLPGIVSTRYRILFYIIKLFTRPMMNLIYMKPMTYQNLNKPPISMKKKVMPLRGRIYLPLMLLINTKTKHSTRIKLIFLRKSVEIYATDIPTNW